VRQNDTDAGSDSPYTVVFLPSPFRAGVHSIEGTNNINHYKTRLYKELQDLAHFLL